MSQHPDNEAAEKYRNREFTGSGRYIGPLQVRDGFLAGATHVRASLAPELENVREKLEAIGNGNEGISCREYTGPGGEGVVETDDAHKVAREALEILSRLMGKGEV